LVSRSIKNCSFEYSLWFYINLHSQYKLSMTYKRIKVKTLDNFQLLTVDCVFVLMGIFLLHRTKSSYLQVS